jgi:hypothetical protein
LRAVAGSSRWRLDLELDLVRGDLLEEWSRRISVPSPVGEVIVPRGAATTVCTVQQRNDLKIFGIAFRTLGLEYWEEDTYE